MLVCAFSNRRCTSPWLASLSCRSISRGTDGRSRAQIREDVNHRRPDVAKLRLIEHYKKTKPMFARWLQMSHRTFRESMHEESFSMRWFRATTTDHVLNFRDWHMVTSKYRYMQIVGTLMGWARSDLVRRLIFPDLTVIACTSTSLCLYNYFLASADSLLTLPTELFTITSMAVGLLVTFRTQVSYSRYERAIENWAQLRAEVRELSSRILSRVPMDRRNISRSHPVWQKRMHGVKLAQSFPHVLKYHVTLTGQNANFHYTADCTEEEVQQKKTNYLRDELALIWDFDDDEEWEIVERLLHPSVKNKPVQVCQEISFLNATWYCLPNWGGVGHPNSEGIDQIVRSLQQVCSDTERIVQIPIYSPYTVFSGRVIYMWLNLLPAALYPLLTPCATPFATVGIAFLLLGIDHVGMRVEQPLHMLPLWQLVDLIDRDCEQIMRNFEALDPTVDSRQDGAPSS